MVSLIWERAYQDFLAQCGHCGIVALDSSSFAIFLFISAVSEISEIRVLT
jgi:hypothetical protein